MDAGQTYKEPDWERIAQLFKLGIAASFISIWDGFRSEHSF